MRAAVRRTFTNAQFFVEEYFKKGKDDKNLGVFGGDADSKGGLYTACQKFKAISEDVKSDPPSPKKLRILFTAVHCARL